MELVTFEFRKVIIQPQTGPRPIFVHITIDRVSLGCRELVTAPPWECSGPPKMRMPELIDIRLSSQSERPKNQIRARWMAVLEWESESQIDGSTSSRCAGFFFSSYYFLSKFSQSII